MSESTNMDGVSRTFTSTLDADGNRTELQGDGGYAVVFDYDGLDRMSDVGGPLASFAYDQLGRRSSLGEPRAFNRRALFAAELPLEWERQREPFGFVTS